ncbi:hypothetical protein DMC63_31040 [Streptomyces sp. WAC 05977]|nr:hypothetical protein DMC63_31040 [Streptomyces sp. WAC 05977]
MLADEIGARTGEVLDEQFSGGMGIMGSPISLVIISLRPGSDDSAAETVGDAARAAGYISPLGVPLPLNRGYLFRGRNGLPQLSVSFTRAGQWIANRCEVPEGRVGVTFSISA